jgi:hypothetical protein
LKQKIEFKRKPKFIEELAKIELEDGKFESDIKKILKRMVNILSVLCVPGPGLESVCVACFLN